MDAIMGAVVVRAPMRAIVVVQIWKLIDCIFHLLSNRGSRDPWRLVIRRLTDRRPAVHSKMLMMTGRDGLWRINILLWFDRWQRRLGLFRLEPTALLMRWRRRSLNNLLFRGSSISSHLCHRLMLLLLLLPRQRRPVA